ncbi:aminotransferase class V-fold PLP-dependent enzyme [Xanthomonas rydalmerensis]|uniref:Aminotransferase class V-fold PLP-dependent enzyme n=1 Tax=Xanthomonas rydalmerensis TaxID=3046274 RepID=A0ABZ0JH46_9XANT|nr:aminotransferase class V-fold PLP-dependent enzyme [Xanthomonas sp. DM-2023]WOS39126.1 aminotransferase class V-fold PLP-dependent enzyme [Xanthomonas sp. DM-2023]WOS43309.1 aminotransferase class V-fold PLP-dependent enzyme [Xanthomonas sp. DM-2023]WOS47488.1 aminotransferase class V-fold PLP-dependent enzyme [Xanthomonas sp. DM-2023]WOS51669.1 aminotransferase class V-fold PLP-dependent enzyme [Xanthomonas sp. DM-2023]WOS55851.1 aminotransferase class V-fold PLP-dependent enzyme [Xanthomo
MISHIDATRVRERMLLPPSVVYLNAGSFGPLPRAVFDTAAALRHRLAQEPTDFLLRQVPDLLWRAREQLAEFLDCAPNRLVFTASVSAATSLVASSLALATPGEILLSDQEYLTMRWCWERIADRHGLALRTFQAPPMPSDPEEIVQAAVHAMGPRTRLLFFSHIASATGLVLPARRICEEAQKRGIISVVDGAHAVAASALRLQQIPCDFYVGSCHKWLLAPSGASFLYLGREREERLQPLTISWGHHSAQAASAPDERDRFGSTPRLRRLECEGTRDICPWLALPEAIAFHRSFKPDQAIAHMRMLAEYARERLATLGLIAATPTDPSLSGPMIAFELPSAATPAQLQGALWDRFHLEVSVIERQDVALLRLSPHVYNTCSDIDYLVECLAALMRKPSSRRRSAVV